MGKVTAPWDFRRPMDVRVKAAELPRAAPVDMQVKEHRQHD